MDARVPVYWHSNIYHQIKQRNLQQTSFFKEIIEKYNSVSEKNVNLQSKNIELEKAVNRITQNNTDLQKKLNDYLENTIDPKRLVELEHKLQTLQEELTQSYKRNSDNATTILDQTKKIKELEEDNKHKEIEIEEWRNKFIEEEETRKKLEEECQILQEELKALQLQLMKTEAKTKQLEKENMELVNRWVQKMNEEASKMNEVNELAQSILMQSKGRSGSISSMEEKSPVGTKTPPPPSYPLLDSFRYFACDIETNEKVQEGHKGEAFSVTYNLSGTLLATGGHDTYVKIWDGRSCNLRATLSGAVQSIMCVRFSPNDELILGASAENSVLLWGVQNGRIRHTLTGHVGKVLSSCFYDSSQKLISGSHDRTIKMWDLSKGYCIRTIFCHSSCNSVCVTTDGVIISGHFDNSVRFWDSKTGDLIFEGKVHSGQITSVSLAPDQRSILTNSKDNTLKIIDTRTHDILQTLQHDNYRNGIAWNEACFRYAAAGSIDGKVCVWNTSNAKLESTLKSSQTVYVSSCAWSPSGTGLASCDKSGFITVWGA